MKLTATLIIYNSKIDRNGNRYWAFHFRDHQTGNQVNAFGDGGESNIYGILRHWNAPDDWDRSIQVFRQELPIREFDRMTKGWPMAGCRSEDIAKFIREKLANPS